MKLKCFSLFLSILTVMLFVMTEPVGVLALEDNRVPDIDSQPKSLTVYFFIQKNGVDTPIEGAEVGIYKIADLQAENGSANYTVSEPYSSLKKVKDGRDVTFEGISFSESTQLAKSFSTLVKTPNKTAATDSQGICTFNDIEQGMYLVCELSANGDAEKYEMFLPYIISVPLAVSYTGVNEWQYDVLSEPKTKMVAEIPDSSRGSGDTDGEESKTWEQSESSEPSEPEKSEVSEPSASSKPEKSEVSEPSHVESSSDSTTVITGDSSAWSFVIAGLWGVSLVIVVMTNIHRKKGADENE